MKPALILNFVLILPFSFSYLSNFGMHETALNQIITLIKI